MSLTVPTENALRELIALKYGARETWGWGPVLRERFGHYNPDDRYEALVASLVTPETRWLEIGCGRNLFPSNPRLARLLADRCRLLVGIDPDPTVLENPFIHRQVQGMLEDYREPGEFDLITLRMVAEHVADPPGLLRQIAGRLAPGGHVVVYTVAALSPVPLMTRVVPFPLRHAVKRFLWETEEKDTFPTCYRMNSRGTLRRQFAGQGLREVLFQRLDDCRTTGRFRALQYVELSVARLCNAFRLPYPEHCLLGVYRRD